MRASFWIACACATSLQQISFGQAIVVPETNVALGESFLGDNELSVSLGSITAENCEDPFCAFVRFSYANGVIDFGGPQLLGQTGDWYLVSVGDIFSDSTIAILPVIYLEHQFPGPNPVQVGTSDFFLGVRLNPSTYGWVQLNPIDGDLTMVANAMSYGSRGIVVGILIVVPEPKSLGLNLVVAGTGIGTRLGRRLRHRQQEGDRG
jgi:hypothetical protein